MKDIYYGGHLSISKGIISAINEINKLKGNMLQIFISNPISIKFKLKTSSFTNDKNNMDIKKKLKETNTKLVIHLPYVINIARYVEKLDKSRWIKLICEQLIIANMIGSIGCIIHVGKYLYFTKEIALQNMYKSLQYIIHFIKSNKLNTFIILETPAGQGTELIPTLNNSIQDFANFYNKFTKDEKKYLKICVDTCHIFAAGYNIKEEKWVKHFFNSFKKLIGINNLALIHLNDSKMPYASRVDRHANIGEGEIGLLGLKHFIKYTLSHRVPIILETPSNYQYQLLLINKIKNNIK